MYIQPPNGPLTAQNKIYLIGFRFIFCYLILFIFPFPFYFVPFSRYILNPLESGLMLLADWIGSLLFDSGYYGYNDSTGSGDTAYHYANAAACLLLALIATLIWSVLDRKRFAYPKLSLILTTFVRFYLAAELIEYGVIKIFPLQFPKPEGALLARTYGQSSPMGLLWTFMGSSPLYSAFTGAGELLAGMLLLFRSTRLTGAVVSAFIFANVFALNLSYDVPVKLFSFHLLLLSVFLAAPLTKKTVHLFSPGEPPLAETVFPQWNTRWMRWGLIAAKSVLIVLILIQPAYDAFLSYRELAAEDATTDEPLIYGAYTISSFARNHETLPEASPGCWKALKLSDSGMEIVYGDDASVQWLSAVRSQKLRIASSDLTTLGEFDLIMHGDALLLTGKLNEDSLRVEARKTGPYLAPLLNRGFHWVSEEPYNR